MVDGATQGTDPVSGPPPATGQAAQVASSVPAAAVPTTPRPGRSANRVAGGLVAAAGGAAMIVGTYLSWLTAYGDHLTGWNLYQARSDVQQDVFVTAGSLFTKSSPLLTGLTTLIIGIALVVIAAAIVALPASRISAGQAGRWDINPGLALLAMLLAACVLIGGVWNLVTWFSTGPHGGVSAGTGLYIVAAGGLAGSIGLVRAIARRTVV